VSISIPQSSPLANYLAHRDEIDAALTRTLDGGWYILGEEVAAFEAEFATYIGVAQAVGVGSGTDALHFALRACGVGSGDAVLTVSHSAVATVVAIELCGAIPVFVDIDPATFTMDPSRLESTIQKHGGPFKAVVPVHIYGHPANMTDLMEIAARHDLRVVEDCAQAHGAKWRGQKVGTFGHAAAFSFYPTKNLGALGDGGAVLTNDGSVSARVRALREYGWEQRYVSQSVGFNSRLDEIQAAILRVKLRHLDNDNHRRIKLADLYSTHLNEEHMNLPKKSSEATHVYHQYVVRSQARDHLRDYLREQGIGTLIHYPVPIHQQPAYVARLKIYTPQVEAETAAREILSLPLFPELRDDQIQAVIQQLGDWQPH
jgi:dTDP-4-amino-4,6-dideoxygalactose transaminase